MCHDAPESVAAATQPQRFKRLINEGWCKFVNDKFASEGQGATIVIGLGLWMLFADMFNSCPAVYQVMQSVASQSAWGIIFILIGALQLFAVMVANFAWRKRMLLFKGALWVALLVTMLYGDWRAPGVPVYFVFAVSAFRSFLCLKPDRQASALA